MLNLTLFDMYIFGWNQTKIFNISIFERCSSFDYYSLNQYHLVASNFWAWSQFLQHLLPRRAVQVHERVRLRDGAPPLRLLGNVRRRPVLPRLPRDRTPQGTNGLTDRHRFRQILQHLHLYTYHSWQETEFLDIVRGYQKILRVSMSVTRSYQLKGACNKGHFWDQSNSWRKSGTDYFMLLNLWQYERHLLWNC